MRSLARLRNAANLSERASERTNERPNDRLNERTIYSFGRLSRAIASALAIECSGPKAEPQAAAGSGALADKQAAARRSPPSSEGRVGGRRSLLVLERVRASVRSCDWLASSSPLAGAELAAAAAVERPVLAAVCEEAVASRAPPPPPPPPPH